MTPKSKVTTSNTIDSFTCYYDTIPAARPTSPSPHCTACHRYKAKKIMPETTGSDKLSSNRKNGSTSATAPLTPPRTADSKREQHRSLSEPDIPRKGPGKRLTTRKHAVSEVVCQVLRPMLRMLLLRKQPTRVRLLLLHDFIAASAARGHPKSNRVDIAQAKKAADVPFMGACDRNGSAGGQEGSWRCGFLKTANNRGTHSPCSMISGSISCDKNGFIKHDLHTKD